jgi:hypothetical protein
MVKQSGNNTPYRKSTHESPRQIKECGINLLRVSRIDKNAVIKLLSRGEELLEPSWIFGNKRITSY